MSMIKNLDIGTFYQGQLFVVTIAPAEDASAEQIEILNSNDVYIGIYREGAKVGVICSTTDDTLQRITDEEGNISFKLTIPPSMTKTWIGNYRMELLIKSLDDRYASPSTNVIRFRVEQRRISEVIR